MKKQFGFFFAECFSLFSHLIFFFELFHLLWFSLYEFIRSVIQSLSQSVSQLVSYSVSCSLCFKKCSFFDAVWCYIVKRYLLSSVSFGSDLGQYEN